MVSSFPFVSLSRSACLSVCLSMLSYRRTNSRLFIILYFFSYISFFFGWWGLNTIFFLQLVRQRNKQTISIFGLRKLQKVFRYVLNILFLIVQILSFFLSRLTLPLCLYVMFKFFSHSTKFSSFYLIFSKLSLSFHILRLYLISCHFFQSLYFFPDVTYTLWHSAISLVCYYYYYYYYYYYCYT